MFRPCNRNLLILLICPVPSLSFFGFSYPRLHMHAWVRGVRAASRVSLPWYSCSKMIHLSMGPCPSHPFTNLHLILKAHLRSFTRRHKSSPSVTTERAVFVLCPFIVPDPFTRPTPPLHCCRCLMCPSRHVPTPLAGQSLSRLFYDDGRAESRNGKGH